MEHLSHETLSDLLDGNPGPGAEEHLASCPACQGELEALRTLSTELRELPPLNPPADLWSRIEARLPYGRRERRLSWPSLVALQAAAMAAVFVLGLALGRAFEPGGAAEGRTVPAAGGVATEPEATGTTSLADALAEVRRLGSEYDAALANLERLAQQEGAPVRSSLARQRLANLEALVEASRAALAADPADPILNSYLFTALEERDAMVRQLASAQGTGPGVVWR